MRVVSVQSNALQPDHRDKISDLLRLAFNSDVHDRNTQAIAPRRYHPKRSNVVVLLDDDSPVAFALTIKRFIRFPQVRVPFLSVGPFAVSPDSQGQGLGRELLSAILAGARNEGCSGLYLQGIPDFYSRQGFLPCRTRSRLEIELNSLQTTRQAVVRKMNAQDLSAVAALYEAQAQLNSGTALRDKDVWQWLLNFASKSYYFLEPQVVEVDGKIIGYFTNDFSDKLKIREAVCVQEEETALIYLSAVADFVRSHGDDSSRLHVMNPQNLVLHRVLSHSLSGEFVFQISQNRGQLMHLLEPTALLSKVVASCLGKPDPTVVVRGKWLQVQDPNGVVQVEVLGDSLHHVLLGSGADQRTVRGPLAPQLIDTFTKWNPFIYQGDNL